ncbi:N-carboxy-L-threonyl-AMP--tRNA (adenosine37-6-N)-N-carboxy-L-threonyltransferase, TsaE subunit [Geotalea daltonii FRC-32]|uniref:tRNA threonylcarbamoyladenosine biosynthesis protein TsaE n=1 Tax=Geotalea daltonii (strain DSM 22248 / JCM 15807 / FRC-32) TaxID=316067 RepID=B9M2T7_GEODF|nr:tRNA (adenosine(37)-N6)-threonylcarbamoyltransferase complex ATPase subunit type 1 TsaE [Geotalea daltonii]ACM21283.1 N-carboxy-L-threonyl-AMP--tRNA (adenosine37-6-N)-N-carboxy-L-threonyltransferase, TsaE subunit [Geotalea daltonii FRC-32]
MTWSLVSKSVEETVSVGKKLGTLLQGGDFVALQGELGAGKTQLAKGIAEGLGVDPSIPVTSPTYTLLNVYSGRLPFYHFDLYRLHGGQDLLDLGFDEYFHGDGICLVEWAERLQEMLPDDYLLITMSHVGDDCRSLSFTSSGSRGEQLIRLLMDDDNEKMF